MQDIQSIQDMQYIPSTNTDMQIYRVCNTYLIYRRYNTYRIYRIYRIYKICRIQRVYNKYLLLTLDCLGMVPTCLFSGPVEFGPVDISISVSELCLYRYQRYFSINIRGMAVSILDTQPYQINMSLSMLEILLSQPKLNSSRKQPNITPFGFDTNIGLHNHISHAAPPYKPC